MKADWSPLKAELAAWRHAGLSLNIWWRDDDAIETSAQLDTLTRLAEDLAMPAHLAIIPKHAKPSVAAQIKNHENLVPLVHGWQHKNQAPADQKKAEFAHPRPDAMDELRLGLPTLTQLIGTSVLPIFVPPWNRIAPEFVGQLSGIGYRALSTYGRRSARKNTSGLIHLNTHIDPIDWRGTRDLVAIDQLVAEITAQLLDRRIGRDDVSEPLGLLTHHLVHTPSVWEFTRDCLSTLLEGGAVPCHFGRDGMFLS